MGLEIYWLEFAESKLNDIYDYYSEKANKKVAKKLILGIVNSTIKISNHPDVGPLEKSLSHRVEKFRFVVFKNYKIIYRTNEDLKRIEIFNVFDTRQDPLKLKQEV